MIRHSLEKLVLTTLSVIMAVTFGFVILYVNSSQRASLMEETDKNVYVNIETIATSLRNIMLLGQGPYIVKTVEDLKRIQGLKQINILRTNGNMAFSDDSTIKFVNAFQNLYEFTPTDRLKDHRDDFRKTIDSENIQKTLSSGKPLKISTPLKREIEYYYPVENLPDCTICHGSDHKIRGIIYVNISSAGIFNRIRQTSLLLAAFFSATGIGLFTILFLTLRRSVIKPILKIAGAVREVGKGNFSINVPAVGGNEIGQLASEINRMIKDLDERFRLARYVSTSTMEVIKLGDDKPVIKNVTVLFADIRGFTAFAENHKPAQVIDVLNKVLESEAECINKYGGDVDKFIGDEVMAVFKDADSAVRCSIEMVSKVEAMHISIKIGIGINTGEVIAGNVGSENRHEYTVVGDTVNIASRLCSLAKPNAVLLTESSYNELSIGITATVKEGIELKGKSKSIRIYEIAR